MISSEIIKQIPQPFQKFIERYQALMINCIKDGCLDELKIKDLLSKERKGVNELNNLLYALLAPGTLLIRTSAIILLCNYKEKILPVEPDVFLNHKIINNLRDNLPADGQWKDIWVACAAVQTNEEGFIGKIICINSGKKKLIERFVTIRNSIVHNKIVFNSDRSSEICVILEDLIEFNDNLSIFSGSRFLEKESKIFFEIDNDVICLYPFILKGESKLYDDIIPYIFQGLYDKKSRLVFLNTNEGDEYDSKSKDIIEEEFDIIAKDAIGIAKNIFDHSQLIEHYLECFVGRENQVKELVEFCNSDNSGPKVLTVSAKPGFGKSALIAKLVDELKGCVLYHFCGAGDRNNPQNIIIHFINQGKRNNLWRNLNDDTKTRLNRMTANWDQLIGLFHELLESYSLNEKKNIKNLTVILDAVDEAFVANPNIPLHEILYTWQKEEGKDPQRILWHIPEYIKFIFTYRIGSYTMPDDIVTFKLNSCQPLEALDESSVETALKDFAITENVKNRIIEYGKVD